MFDGIAARYDLLNRLTTFGIDKRWRKKAVEKLGLGPGQTLLDVAAGTLDISIAAARKYPSTRVIAADPSREMMKMGVKKVSPNESIHLVTCTAEQLPFSPETVHAAIIAFGIRNFTNRAQALRKLYEIIRPGGRLVILELCIPKQGLLAPVATLYVERVIPLMGALLSSGAEYAYLPESMKKFPQPEDFQSELQSAGFDVIESIPFMAGACSLFVSRRRTESEDR